MVNKLSLTKITSDDSDPKKLRISKRVKKSILYEPEATVAMSSFCMRSAHTRAALHIGKRKDPGHEVGAILEPRDRPSVRRAGRPHHRVITFFSYSAGACNLPVTCV